MPVPVPMLVEATDALAVDLAEVRTHLRIDGDDQDGDLTTLVHTATQAVEAMTRRQLLTATYTIRYDVTPWAIVLPKPPLVSVESITYVDSTGDEQTLSPDLYRVRTDRILGVVEPARNASWPYGEDVVVTFVCGYGSTADDVPQVLRHAIRELAASMYLNREGGEAQVRNMVRAYRVEGGSCWLGS